VDEIDSPGRRTVLEAHVCTGPTRSDGRDRESQEEPESARHGAMISRDRLRRKALAT
jgi:hypothetical protein